MASDRGLEGAWTDGVEVLLGRQVEQVRRVQLCQRGVEGFGDAIAPEVGEPGAARCLEGRAHLEPVGADQVHRAQDSVEPGEDAEVALGEAPVLLGEAVQFEVVVAVPLEGHERLARRLWRQRELELLIPLVVQVPEVLADVEQLLQRAAGEPLHLARQDRRLVEHLGLAVGLVTRTVEVERLGGGQEHQHGRVPGG